MHYAVIPMGTSEVNSSPWCHRAAILLTSPTKTLNQKCKEQPRQPDKSSTHAARAEFHNDTYIITRLIL